MAHEGSRQVRDRGVARSKAEKVRPPTVPVPQIDIVPGRLNEAEWMALLAIEEGEDVVGDILADLLMRVMDASFQVYLTQQCIPFTISQAREAMLQITEWRFLARDEGETAVAEDPTWGEDEEPSTCTTDSWAQGSVPVLHPSTSTGLEDTFQSQQQSVSDLISVGRDFQVQSWEPCFKPRLSSGAPPTPVLQEEEGNERDNRFASWTGSLDNSFQSSVGPESEDNLHPSVEASQENSLLSWAQSAQGSSQLSLEDLYYIMSQSDAAGDRLGFGLRKVSPRPSDVSLQSSLSLVSIQSSLSLVSQQFNPKMVFLQPSPRSVSLQPRPKTVSQFQSLLGAVKQQPSPRWQSVRRRSTLTRLDPARLPQRWARPLVEVVLPGSEARPQRHERPRDQGPLPQAHVSQTFKTPLQPGISLRALDQDLGRQPPPLSSGLRSPDLQSRLSFPSSALCFLATDSVHGSMTHSPGSQIQPAAKWPRGREAEAKLLSKQLVGDTQEPLQELDQEDSEYLKHQDVQTWSHPMPQVLKTTSQVMWKPMLLPEAMKLAPGVSLWNPVTQVLLNPTVPQEDKDDTSLPTQQCPIQTAAPKPQVTVDQLMKNSIPKVWSQPSKDLPPSEP